jgi:putative transposase
VRFAFIKQHAAQHAVRLLCRVLCVSTSGYYAWASRPPSHRQADNLRLLGKIRHLFKASRQTYGSPSIQRDLRKLGEPCSRRRVARLMREDGLRVLTRPRYKVTTDSKHSFAVADNLLQRRFNVGTAPAAWAGDITYIRTGEGWLYLAVLLSVNTRRVVGHAMGRFIDTNLCLAALRMAAGRVAVPAGLLHHSDRGKQYCSATYRRELGLYGLRPSMSRCGDPWDNAPVESFFSTLKRELVHRRNYHTRDQARRDIFEFIEVFYNRQRRHTALDYLTPEEYAKINNLP